MSAPAVRRLAPPSDPAWEDRFCDITAAAQLMAYAARSIDVGDIAPFAHWNRLSSYDRSLWFAIAWRAITGLEREP